jgi:hypothetical protein
MFWKNDDFTVKIAGNKAKTGQNRTKMPPKN